MKKFLLTLLAIILILGVLGGAGFAGYRIGFNQGRELAAATSTTNQNQPSVRGDNFGFWHMPNFGRDAERGFQRGFGPGGFGMMMHGRGFGFFSPIRLLVQLAILGFIVWIVYKLLTGWRLSFTRPAAVQAPKVEPAAQPVESESKNDETTG